MHIESWIFLQMGDLAPVVFVFFVFHIIMLRKTISEKEFAFYNKSIRPEYLEQSRLVIDTQGLGRWDLETS